jgi:LacI family transcriptional regulator
MRKEIDVASVTNTPRVTMKDIAKATGYTVNTVSHALKDRRDISKETKDIIRLKAKELGYLTDMVAVSMRSGITHTLAIIIPDIANPFFATKVKEMDITLREKGYNTIIMNTDENSDFEYDAVCSAISRKVDGVIICPTQRREDIFSLMERYGMPFVVIGRRLPDRKVNCVVWDDVHGGFLATEHLIALGKKRILYLNGPSHISSSNDRLAGYRQALEQYGIPFDEQLVIETNIVETTGCESIHCILESGILFDAIFAFSDFIACSVISTLSNAGISVPIVGFDDILSELNLPFHLTSISVCKDDEAKAIIKLLLGQIKKHSTIEPHTVVLETFIVRRAVPGTVSTFST